MHEINVWAALLLAVLATARALPSLDGDRTAPFRSRKEAIDLFHPSLSATQATSFRNHKRQTLGSIPLSGFVPSSGGTSANGQPYNEKKNAGLIPDIASAEENSNGLPVYPSTVDVFTICSWTYTKCNEGDIWLTPNDTTAITFDDGPTAYLADLAEFLSNETQPATHFLIGSAIINAPEASASIHLATAYKAPKSDLAIVGELGWTMQLIYEWTGKVPMYWRAPQGDVDDRVRAITREVETGLESYSNVTYASVVEAYKSWTGAALGNTSIVGTNKLMHELTDQSMAAFKEYYAYLQGTDYKAGSVASIIDAPWYQNQMTPDDPTEAASSIIPTREAMNTADGGLHSVGSAKGTALGPFATLDRTTTVDSSSTQVDSSADGSGSTGDERLSGSGAILARPCQQLSPSVSWSRRP
ncbi:carbohydrate esterase family 4 protein [Tilletiaria anomala UBC 951]|uniref:chitin deacetylase n=1 Tax=Tilletiaria anomala (strain ATCC 24038 / CBS 436.72 / UBC 951) TaxID=1037660 RepID=A0A066VYH1_TILAU|nr:carbohydrate esterase family 4 protein [Tilletiaria anomala UBC 951]KDN46777.1 carbohydrate esterase family 4 protein [Tilletiaria anomala UBC 951]